MLLAIVAFSAFSLGKCTAPDDHRQQYFDEVESHRLTRAAWMDVLESFAVYASRMGDEDLADEIYRYMDNPSGMSQYDYVGDPDPPGL